MDSVLYISDEYFFDNFYAKIWPAYTHSSNGTFYETVSSWPRTDPLRIYMSLYIVTCLFAFILYFSAATISYYYVFDHDYMKHPKFLKNQVRMEIECAMGAIPWMTIMTLPFFAGEILGQSMLYDGIPQTAYDWICLLGSIPAFLLFTDCGIYWIHRWMHHPAVYQYLHKLHHKWVIPTPFSSYAFNPCDGFLQSLPYHIYVYMIPMHKYLYLGIFAFVTIWTIMIHNGEFISHSEIINTSAHHFVHHVYFNYNYGQYFTLWDRIGNSHRQPTDEQYVKQKRDDHRIMTRQAQDAERIEAEVMSIKSKRE